MPKEMSSSRATELRSAAAGGRGTSRSATARTRRTASVPDAALTLYQTEWCPFSSAVREVLTELGMNFVARQVEPWPKDRTELKAVADTDQIPVLQTEDGRLFRGPREILAHLLERELSRAAAWHRRRVYANPDRPRS